jgi:hypothetical protein
MDVPPDIFSPAEGCMILAQALSGVKQICSTFYSGQSQSK